MERQHGRRARNLISLWIGALDRSLDTEWRGESRNARSRLNVDHVDRSRHLLHRPSLNGGGLSARARLQPVVKWLEADYRFPRRRLVLAETASLVSYELTV